MLRVVIHPHAYARIEERGAGVAMTPNKLQIKIYNALRVGAKVEDDGTIRVPVNRCIEAVCRPLPGSRGGGWECMTFLLRKEA